MKLINGYKLMENNKKVTHNGFVCPCNKDGKYYALKVFTKNFSQYYQEIYILKALKSHTNIIQLIDYFELQDEKVIVLEYCSHDLKSLIYNNNDSVNQLDRLILIGKIVRAFKSIHDDLSSIKLAFQHRDIKPQNFMLSQENHLKIVDFGLSSIIDETTENENLNQICGTPGYMDPMMEYMGQGYKRKSDIWSLGATFYFILTNKVLPIKKSIIYNQLYDQQPRLRKQWKMIFIQGIIDETLNNEIENIEIRNLLSNLLKVDTKYRYDWQNLFTNEFIIQLDKLIPLDGANPQIKLSKQLQLCSQFSQPYFFEQTDQSLIQIYEYMTIKGQFCYLTAKKMFLLFKELKKSNQDFQQNWQDFEKCNYLLQLRSLIILNNFNQILNKKLNKYNQEQICETLMKKLFNPDNSEIYEQIYLKVYNVFENIQNCVAGKGLVSRISNLRRLPVKYEDYQEYPTQLLLDYEEQYFFSYNKNNLAQFEREEFYQLYQRYLLKCIKVFLQNFNLLDQNGQNILNEMISCYQIEVHFQHTLYIDSNIKNRKLEITNNDFLFQNNNINFQSYDLQLEKGMNQAWQQVFIKSFSFQIIFFNQMIIINQAAIGKEYLEIIIAIILFKLKLKTHLKRMIIKKAFKYLQSCSFQVEQYVKKKLFQIRNK